ncbi:hypothetical protein HJ01_00987 [Flavobacterium frigoris PS1]|uniref:Uncharacterized protein n=1 Tax=Flavobacterium frigoris (strain PS1) TaxID=1086011 RepID=H7FP89_FLAFP|nr:hypothetical protein HJ01_00987 [Flavobacterium frigoris PS1]
MKIANRQKNLISTYSLYQSRQNKEYKSKSERFQNNKNIFRQLN